MFICIFRYRNQLNNKGYDSIYFKHNFFGKLSSNRGPCSGFIRYWNSLHKVE